MCALFHFFQLFRFTLEDLHLPFKGSEAATKEMARTLLEQERPTTMIDALGNVRSCPVF